MKRILVVAYRRPPESTQEIAEAKLVLLYCQTTTEDPPFCEVRQAGAEHCARHEWEDGDLLAFDQRTHSVRQAEVDDMILTSEALIHLFRS